VDLQAAFECIDAFAAQQLAFDAAPGISIAITDKDGLLHSSAHGYANLAARTSLTTEHMSEFGSIGKSFTAIICLQLHEEGRLDLHAPITEYLPWFDVRSRHEPITTHHLLTHSSGLIGGTDFTPDPRFEVWALRDTEAVAAPGVRFRYSNVGYKALGIMLEHRTGESYGALVRARILEPLAMRDTAPFIDHALRERLMVGYGWRFDDRPNRSDAPLEPATWLETNTADGCIASTPADLATYLRMLMNGGVGPTGRILSETAFNLMATPHINVDAGRQARQPEAATSYGYGLGIINKDNRRLLGHGGGMVGYYSEMLADLDSGFGVIAFINGPGQLHHAVAQFALDTLRAAANGEQLPELPEPPEPLRIDNAADYAGVYHSDDGTLELRADGDRLSLRLGNGWTPLARAGNDSFLVDAQEYALFPLRFGRNEEDAVVEARHGAHWWRGERYDGPTAFDAPAEWNAYAGHYRSHDPWGTNFRIVPRKGELWLVYPSGGEEPLTPLGDGSFRVTRDPLASDFVRFDAVVDGEALRANYCGCDYYRFFTP